MTRSAEFQSDLRHQNRKPLQGQTRPQIETKKPKNIMNEIVNYLESKKAIFHGAIA